MNQFYLATVIAALVTVFLASNLLLVVIRGSTMPGMPPRLRLGLRRARRRLKHVIDLTVAANLANRERRATLFWPHEGIDRRAGGGRAR